MVLTAEKEKIYNKIVHIVAQRLDIEEQRITLDATLSDLGADSLDLFEIILDLEEQFNIEIDDETAEKLKNVQDVVIYVHSLIQN